MCFVINIVTYLLLASNKMFCVGRQKIVGYTIYAYKNMDFTKT